MNQVLLQGPPTRLSLQVSQETDAVCPHFIDEEAECRGDGTCSGPPGEEVGDRFEPRSPSPLQYGCVSEQQHGRSRDRQTCDSPTEIHPAGPAGPAGPLRGEAVSRGAAEVCFTGTGPVSWAALTLKDSCL